MYSPQEMEQLHDQEDSLRKMYKLSAAITTCSGALAVIEHRTRGFPMDYLYGAVAVAFTVVSGLSWLAARSVRRELDSIEGRLQN